jgi:hypothetical protein
MEEQLRNTRTKLKSRKLKGKWHMIYFQHRAWELVEELSVVE